MRAKKQLKRKLTQLEKIERYELNYYKSKVKSNMLKTFNKKQLLGESRALFIRNQYLTEGARLQVEKLFREVKENPSNFTKFKNRIEKITKYDLIKSGFAVTKTKRGSVFGLPFKLKKMQYSRQQLSAASRFLPADRTIPEMLDMIREVYGDAEWITKLSNDSPERIAKIFTNGYFNSMLYDKTKRDSVENMIDIEKNRREYGDSEQDINSAFLEIERNLVYARDKETLRKIMDIDKVAKQLNLGKVAKDLKKIRDSNPSLYSAYADTMKNIMSSEVINDKVISAIVSIIKGVI